MKDCTSKEKIWEDDLNHWEKVMKKQGYLWGVIYLCQIMGRSRKLENKKWEKRVTQLRIK